jgi:hypothetical protein
MRTRHHIATFASELESAGEIARIEIEQIASDPNLPERFDPKTLFPS